MSENPFYHSAGNHDAKAVHLPRDDDITVSKERSKEENPYEQPVDNAWGGMMNPCFARSPPLRVSLGVKGDEVTRAGEHLNAYMKGAGAAVRASSTSQRKKFNRQKSGEKDNRQVEKQSLKMGEVRTSFENPFYRERSRSGGSGRNGSYPLENPIYSTISETRPRLLPTRSPTINEASAESVEILEQDDPQYEELNFGNSTA